MNDIADIFYIICIPQSEFFYNYYINNSKDPHMIQAEKLKGFISQFELPGNITKIHEHIKSFQSFVIDIQSNKVSRLLPDKEKSVKKSNVPKVEHVKRSSKLLLNIDPLLNKFIVP